MDKLINYIPVCPFSNRIISDHLDLLQPLPCFNLSTQIVWSLVYHKESVALSLLYHSE